MDKDTRDEVFLENNTCTSHLNSGEGKCSPQIVSKFRRLQSAPSRRKEKLLSCVESLMLKDNRRPKSSLNKEHMSSKPPSMSSKKRRFIFSNENEKVIVRQAWEPSTEFSRDATNLTQCSSRTTFSPFLITQSRTRTFEKKNDARQGSVLENRRVSIRIPDNQCSNLISDALATRRLSSRPSIYDIRVRRRSSYWEEYEAEKVSRQKVCTIVCSFHSITMSFWHHVVLERYI